MMRRAVRWAVCSTALTAAVFALAWPVAAQTADSIVVRIASVDDTRFPTISAVFTADEGGRPLANLRPEDVTIIESGASARATSLQVAADTSMPLALVVTFDTSGSMAGANLVQSKAAATALFRSLSPTDIGALITFADEVRVAVPLPGTAANLEAAVGGLQATGNTALYDAVAESGRVAASSGVLRRAVVLFSDGEDFGGRSQISRAQSLQEAASGQALFYVIGIGQQVDRAYLEELATRSGGRYFQAQSAAEVAGIYASIETLLRSQYIVTFEATSPADTQARTLNIGVTAGGNSGSGQIAYTSQRQAPTPTAVPATAVPTPIPAAVVEPEPETSSSGEGSDALALWLVLAAVVLIGGVVALVMTRRSGREPEKPAVVGSGTPLPRTEPLARPALRGALTAFRGDESVQSLAIDGKPVTIGPGGACDLRLVDPQLDGIELRLWWRDGSAMAHVVKERGVHPLLNGAPFRWASLKDGDELQLGPYLVRYRTEVEASGR